MNDWRNNCFGAATPVNTTQMHKKLGQPLIFHIYCYSALLFYLMVCSEVVDLPPEHLCPEVFTDELHYIQLILEAGSVPGQPMQSEDEHRH